jgi:hypothetical protein
MNWKEYKRKRSWNNLRYYHGIYLAGLRKTTINLSQDRRSPDLDLNPELTEYEAGVLTTRPCRDVQFLYIIIQLVL